MEAFYRSPPRCMCGIMVALLALAGTAASAQPTTLSVGESEYKSPWERVKAFGTKITGGKPVAELKYWPGVAALRFRDTKDNVAYFCGGTLIADQWLVTAAHCLRDWQCKGKSPADRVKTDCAPKLSGEMQEFTDYAPHGFKGPGTAEVVAGVTDLSKPIAESMIFQIEQGYIFDKYAQEIARRSPGWCGSSAEAICGAEIGHDIALVKLKRKIADPKMLARISASSSNDDPPEPRGKDVFRWPVGIAGYGCTRDGGKLAVQNAGAAPKILAASKLLMETMVPTVHNARCQTYFGSKYKIFDSEVCASDEMTTDRDTCLGDSGGPLMTYDKTFRPYLLGITSWGARTSRSASPGVYTRISSDIFQKWMTKLGVKPQKLAPSERVDYAADLSAVDAVRKLKNGGDLQLEICATGQSLACSTTVPERLPSDDFLATRIETDQSSGNLVLFWMTPVGHITQLFPRGSSTLESATFKSKSNSVLPRAGTGWPVDWDVYDGSLIAVLLPPSQGDQAIKNAEIEISNAGMKPKPNTGVPENAVQYINTIRKAIVAANGQAAVAEKSLPK